MTHGLLMMLREVKLEVMLDRRFWRLALLESSGRHRIIFRSRSCGISAKLHTDSTGAWMLMRDSEVTVLSCSGHGMDAKSNLPPLIVSCSRHRRPDSSVKICPLRFCRLLCEVRSSERSLQRFRLH